MSNPLGEGFKNVEAQADDPAMFFHILDIQAALPSVVAMRKAALDLLNPVVGGRYVDVGCGTGEVARSIAAVAGPGSVTGIDASPVMIEEAIRRSGDDAGVDFRVGDALALDIEDASMDAAHCERVLQHVADPDRGFSELVRVTKPGGRVVVADTDWDTAIMDSVPLELERAMRRDLADGFRNGTIGRGLRRMFFQAGLRDIGIQGHTLIFTELDEEAGVGPPISKEVAGAVATGTLTQEQGETIVKSVSAAAAAGVFFASVTMFLCVGTRG